MRPDELSALLPARLVLRTSFEAKEDQLLPALPTTALHGALLRAAMSLVCVQPRRRVCEGCPARRACSYPALFEPAADTESGGGADLPPPVVLRPEAGIADGPLRLARGERLHVRVGLLGQRAIAERVLVLASLGAAAHRGLGIREETTRTESRPRLGFANAEDCEPARLAPAAAWRLTLSTPLRVKVDGHIRGSLDSDGLWAAMVRRVRALCALYGGGAPTLPREAPFDLGEVRLQVREVTRYSSRQKTRMTWPGLLGTALVRAHVGAEEFLAPLFAFLSEAQLGKGTLFGFGSVSFETA